MSRTRYDPIPQTAPAEEIIDLHSIYPPSYNYNSGVPSSPPPPSFHTTASSPPSFDAGPRPRSPDDHTPVPTPAAPIQIQDLHIRLARLEEALGKILLEKEEGASPGTGIGTGSDKFHRQNCCVTFSLEEDAESVRGGNNDHIRALMARSHGNCCVRIEGRRRKGVMGRRVLSPLVVVGVLVMVGLVFGVVFKALDVRKAGAGSSSDGHTKGFGAGSGSLTGFDED